MPNRQIELALKQGRLLERIAAQRAALSTQMQPVVRALETADQGLAMTRSGIEYVKHHPGQLGAAVALIAILQPKRVWRWGRRAFVAWSLWHKLRQRLESAGINTGAISPRRGSV